MLEAIRDSGFTPVPEDVRLAVTGTLVLRQGRFVLVLDQMKNARELRLSPGSVEDDLRKASGEGTSGVVVIHGRWLSQPNADLLVEAVGRPRHPDQ